jgi:mRNA interferase MazF
VVWVDFEPTVGREIGKRRPAVVLSSRVVNRKIGRCVAVPVSGSKSGSPTEVPLPETPRVGVTGAAMVDQMRTIHWEARHVEFAGRVPGSTLDEIADRVCVLIGVEPKD